VSAEKLEVKSAMALEFSHPEFPFAKSTEPLTLALSCMAFDLFAFHLLSTHAASLQLARPLASNPSPKGDY